MPTEFSELRKRARLKRDKAVNRATAEYERTLDRIAELEKTLSGARPHRRTISSCIESVMPTDRTFTVPELLEGLENLEPDRNWRKRSVEGHVSHMLDRGVIRRIRRATNKRPGLYAHNTLETVPEPFEDMTLADAMEKVLGDSAMHQVDIAIELLKQGYDTASNRQMLRESVRKALRREKARFVERDENWEVLPH